SSPRSWRRSRRCVNARRNSRKIRSSFGVSSPKAQTKPARPHDKHWTKCAARCIFAQIETPSQVFVKPELKVIVSNPQPEPVAAQHAPEQVEMPFAVVNGEP